MNRFFLTALGMCLLLGTASVLAAEARIGFVNTPRLLELAPQAKLASERLEQEFAPRESELAAAQKNLKAQEEKLARDGALMTLEERGKLEINVRMQERDLKRSREDFTQELNLRRNEEFSRLQREVGDAIVAIAKQDGYDLIFETGVVYASERVDLTERVLGLLRQQFEAQNKKKTK
ncbi:MAG: OmpH family outer membrane protein [Pseudomonadota bacterium]